MANEGNSSGRVLWYNPNPSNDVPIPNENLNVYVNLYVKTKGKSVIVGKQLFNTSDEKEKEIRFFSGTKSNPTDTESPSYLTTNYTTLQSYSLNDDDDYSEMLGIESINIDFNTSMAPMIKIKLIDVRGAAIFAKNGKGKYDFFFQMPYPLFHLELKGYYGYPIEYCLHLIRFNSNFNSQTGNFEIECDFIGYTYALLNDMQMGLLRACEKTTIGKQKFNELKNEYKGNIEILTIEDTIKKISSINDVTNTVKRDEASVKAINKIDSIISDCGKLIENIKTFINDVSSSSPNFSSDFKSDYYCHGRVEGKFNSKSEEYKNFLNNYDVLVSKQKDMINNNIIKNLTPELNSIFTQLLSATNTNVYLPFIAFILLGMIKNNTNNISVDYDTCFEDNDVILDTCIGNQYQKGAPYYEDIKKTIINKLQVDGYDKYTYIFLDFRVAVDRINKFIQALNEEKIKKENIISEKTRKELKNKIGFDSSIRSLFRILTTSVEVFLSTMMEVSSQAENSAVRKTELNKLLSNLNNVYGEQNIYPWPEYRAKKEDGSYYEKYLGIDVNKKNVNELMFTEELIEIMIQQAKDDRVYLGGVNGSNAVNSRLWWPISVVDGNIPIGTQGEVLEVKKNPYEVILSTRGELYGGYADSAKLLMILRGFLLLGFANRNHISDDAITLHAKLEAWNLKNAIDNVVGGNNKLTLKQTLYNLTYDIIKKFGKEKIIFQQPEPEPNKPPEPLKYSWILSSTGKSYLPINKGFNKVKFYKNNIILNNNEAVELRRSGYIFVGQDSKYKPSKDDDGAIYVNIIDAEKVDGKNHVPNFGQQSLSAVDYSTKFAGKKISYSDFEEAIKKEDNTKLYVNPLDANKSINVYSEINYVVPYDGVSKNLVGDNLGKDSTLPLFFADIPNGYSYNNIIVKVDTDVYKKNDYFYSHFREESDKNKPLKVYTSGRNMYKPNGRVENGKILYSPNDGLDYVKRYNDSEAKGYRHKLVEVLSNPNDDLWSMPFIGYVFNNEYKRTIFGSAFYYSQTTPEAKAFLYLHCFPFQGVVKPSNIGDDSTEYNMFDLDKNPKILGLKALFTAHNGLIKVPNIWARFIGAILWRLESVGDPINFKQLVLDNGTNPPTKEEFLYVYTNKGENPYCGMHFKTKLNKNEFYSNIDAVLLNLPKQVKNEFINYFKTYVNGYFKDIQKNLEIGGGNITFDEFKTIREKYKNELNQNNNTITKAKVQEIFSDEQKNPFLNVDYFINIGLDIEDGGKNFIMEAAIGARIGYVYIQNINPRIWSNHTTDEYDPILVKPTQFELYTNEFIKTFKALVGEEIKRAPEEDKEIKAELFNTTDNDDIRLNVYRTLMAIYQKWISGTQSGEFFSQCSVHPKDEKIAEFERNTTNTGSRLIESFRFVDRAYFDIGDKLYINPKTFSELIINNKGATFFDVSNRILSDNNFLFLPLPSFVNFNDVNELKGIFTPQIMSNEGKQGPSFVCVYAGQISNHLDLTNDVYKDDGVYITVDDAGNLGGLPEDFAKSVDSVNNPYEMNVPVFAVNFGQQNQNFFKDIKLDQKEFSETSESLEIIQDISNQGDKTKVTSIGQNLFNVYQKRSYSCEIEMMGNLAIQPLMYFQLNNIPMFKGLYLIIKVSHTVKPNSISTTFKGVRIKKTKTPLVENNTILLNLTNTSSSTGGATGGVGNGASMSTTTNSAQSKLNQIFIIKWLKNKGLTKIQVAGIMGNMYKETGGKFNPDATNPYDGPRPNPALPYSSTNCRTTDYGLIQWNSGGWNDVDCQKGCTDVAASVGCIKSKVGDTLEKQLNYLFDNYTSFNEWKNDQNKSNNNAEDSAYWFANRVERCAGCTGSKTDFLNDSTHNAGDRARFAIDYYNKFNDSNNEFYWDTIESATGSNTTSNSSTTKINIVIGDSLAPNVLKGISKAGDDTFEILTQLQESGLSAETFLSSKLNNYNVINNKVKNVVVSLGTNGIYVTTQSIVDKITAKLKTLFPNAKLMIVKGTYGPNVAWSNSLKKNDLQPTVNTYYTLYRNKGFYVVNPAIGDLPNAHTYAPIYKEIGADIITNKNS